MSALITALSSGLTAEKILDYIMRKVPEFKPKIAKSLSAGMTADQIVKFFSKDKNEQKLKQSMQEKYSMDFDANPIVQGESIRGQNLATDMASGLQRAAPIALAGAAGLATNMALQHALPNQLKDQTQKKMLPNQVETTSQPPVVPNIAQIPNNQPPEGIIPQSQAPKAADILEGLGLRRKAEELRLKKKDPEIIARVLSKSLSGEAKAKFDEMVKNGQAPGFKELIDQFLSEPATMQLAQLPEGKEMNFGGLLEPIEPPEFKAEDYEVEPHEKIKKSSVVATPQGVGEVQEIRNGQAIVEVDGKKHQVSEDELIQSPLPEKDLADLYDELISGIEKSTGKQVSRNVEWAGYDPKTNELGYKPHGSDKIYSYEEISPEDVELLTSLLTQRKSTGENFIGAWESGSESPIGAAMYQLIKKLQSERGGKGNEYRNRYETIYDALEPAKLAAKRKHAERKKKAKKHGIA